MKENKSDKQNAGKNELEVTEKKSVPAKRKTSQEEDGLQLVSIDNLDHIEKKEKQKKNKSFVFGKKTRIIITSLALIVFIGAGIQLYRIMSEYRKGDQLYEDVLDSYTTVSLNREEEQDEGEDYSDGNIMPYNKVEVDFEGLKKINSDVVGWIQFEHVDISYPIVQGTDNSYYLNHTVKKTENKEGSIFMDYKNNKNFTDTNTIIYGHNMKNGSMFGLMGQYKNAEFYLGRECFWIYTPTADYRFLIFSCYEPKADDENVYTFWSAPCEAYEKYLEKAKAASKYPTEVSALSMDDKIVTLSTCTSRGKDYRFVVQGKLIETIEK